MEVDYASTMEQLQAMFPDFDEETIKTVLAANDGQIERTIDDLMKLTEEVENSPDDDNLFSDPQPRFSQGGHSNSYNQSSKTARDLQESEDAKLAYELQMQYMQQSQNQPQNPGNFSNQANIYSTDNMGNGRVSSQSDSTKKKGFYKKLKVAMHNLFSRKGKSGKKGPTKNPGIYNAIDPAEENGRGLIDDEPDLFRYQENEQDEQEPAMNLDDVMRNNRYENENERDHNSLDHDHENENQHSPRDYPPQRGNLARDYNNNYSNSNRHDQYVTDFS